MKMFYTAYTNKGNTGDLLITKYQIEEYSKYGEVYVDCYGMPAAFKKVIFDTESPNIKNFEKEYGISYRSKSILSVFNILNKNGFTHFCGSPGPREPLGLPFRKFLFKISGGILPFVFLKKNIKVISLGVDVNYELNGFWGWINNWYFRRFDIIGIRSKANVGRLSERLRNIIYTPDMAFLYPEFDISEYSKQKKRVAFSFREVLDYKKLLEILISICCVVNKQDLTIDILYQVEEDQSICLKLKRDLEKFDVNFVEKQIGFRFLNMYKDYDMVISNRLHVLLMAAMNGALPFGIISGDSKENKIKDIFESTIGVKYITYIGSFNSSIFLDVFDNRLLLKKEVGKSIEQQRVISTDVISKTIET